MRTRSAAKSHQKRQNPQTSSKFCHSKRRREKSSSNFCDSKRRRQIMDASEWWPHDLELLELLSRVRNRREVYMGDDYSDEFYQNFAAKLSENVGVSVTSHDVADGFRHFRSIHRSYQGIPDGFRHPSIDIARYNALLQICFGQEMKAVKIPRHLGNRRNRGSHRSPSCSSNSSIARTILIDFS